MNNIKKVYLKLGSNCNLQCKYCHAEHMDCQFNPEILPILKSWNLKRISFGGGEPLLYWNIIKQIVQYIGNDVQYRIVTNGTLLTQDIVDSCNQYNFLFFISLDGIKSTRDNRTTIQWDVLSKLKHCGTAVTFYQENSDMQELFVSLIPYKKYLSIPQTLYSSFPNFVHSTSKTGVQSSKELATLYVKQLSKILEDALKNFLSTGKKNIILIRCLNDFYKIKHYNGIRCCNDKSISMLADGTIVSCPYIIDKVGDIFSFDQIDWQKIKEKHMRNSCHVCDLYEICGNYCYVNITNDECLIMKKMHQNIINLLKKYNITDKELELILR